MKAESKWYESLINQNDNYFSDKQNNILLKTNKNNFEKEILDLMLRDFGAEEDGRNNELLKILISNNRESFINNLIHSSGITVTHLLTTYPNPLKLNIVRIKKILTIG